MAPGLERGLFEFANLSIEILHIGLPPPPPPPAAWRGGGAGVGGGWSWIPGVRVQQKLAGRYRLGTLSPVAVLKPSRSSTFSMLGRRPVFL